MVNISKTLSSKYGCWVSNSVPFTAKIDAYRHAYANRSGPVSFYFHNQVWEKFDKSLLGKIPLTTLYKERALQIRDKYDYVVLHYSGGADSHNILETFLTNNIKLDEVMVRWPKHLIDGNGYTPNTKDISARNAASEWNYSIKPTLDRLKISNPEIKINIVDYAEYLGNQSLGVDQLTNRLSQINIGHLSLGSTVIRLDPNCETKLSLVSPTSRKVGHVIGTDKPYVTAVDGKVYFKFLDSFHTNASMVEAMGEDRVELFYWSADLPLLPVEQAYQIALYFNHNKAARPLLESPIWFLTNNHNKSHYDAAQRRIFNSVLYKDTWDNNKFQVVKPNKERSDWYFWLHELPELDSLRKAFYHGSKEFTSGVSPMSLVEGTYGFGLKLNSTPMFHLLDLTT